MVDMISIIIPVYNCEKFITKCIDSILKQIEGYEDTIEIVVVDDGSTDGSFEKCKKYEVEYQNIIVVQQDNKGVSAARNVGIEVSKGDSIIFVDADDYIPEGAMQYYIKYSGPYDLIVGSVLIIGGEATRILFSLEEKESCEELAYKMMINPTMRLLMSGVWGKIFNKSIITDNGLKFDEKYRNGEDGLFIIDYLKHIGTVHFFVNSPPIYYLIRYTESERISAVSFVYPDFFEFYSEHSSRLYELVSKECDLSLFYQAYVNELIIHLVRAYAYMEFWDKIELHRKIKDLIHDELLKNGIKVYKRPTNKTSVLIPIFIRLKMNSLLNTALKKRANKYNHNREKSRIITSVYREN